MEITEISFPVIKVSQPLGEFFIGSMDAKTLVEISFSDVRRIENEERDVERYLGIQRPLDKVRVKTIKKYLDSPDASFPTGVILAIDQKCAEYDVNKGVLHLMSFQSEFTDEPNESIPIDKIAKVLDGQHRIAAFMREDGSYDEELSNIDFQFNIVVYIGLDPDAQANIFATVNLAQTKVNRSLVYDLEGLSKTRSPFRTCHLIAVALDSVDEKGPLYWRIKRLGVKTKDRNVSEPLTQASFVEALMKLISPHPFEDRTIYMRGKKPKLVDGEALRKFPFRNMFIEGRDQEIAMIVHNYFTSIRNKWPSAWDKREVVGNILPRSNAFKAFMRYLKVAYLKLVGNEIGRIVSVVEFDKIFSELEVSDADFTSGNFKPGSGGESAFYKLLTKAVTIQELKNDDQKKMFNE